MYHPVMNDPIIDFTSIAGQDVFASCSGMPSDGQIQLVNQMNRSVAGSMSSRNGPITFKMPAATAPGAYYLNAVDGKGNRLAQSVVFYVAGPGETASA